MWLTLPAASLITVTLALAIFSLLTLFFERKFIAIAQKRLGISFLGRNGWAHLPADLLKFWFKYTGRHSSRWNSLTGGVVGGLLAYFAWSLAGCIFFVSDNGTATLDWWEYQLLAYFAYANLSTLFMFFIVVGTRSKYATLSAGRLIIVSLLMDVFFMLCFLLLYIHIGGYSFEAIASANADGWLLFSLPPLAFFFLLYALFEAKRAPFDHTEAESELVAGHLVEFGGRSLLFFYLCEYAHAYFCMYLIVIVCLGGPEPLVLSQFLPYWAQVQATLPII